MLESLVNNHDAYTHQNVIMIMQKIIWIVCFVCDKV